MLRLRSSLFFLPLAALFAWIGWGYYSYFFDQSAPVIHISGIKQDGAYAGDVSVRVAGSDEYKVGELSLFIDEKPLVATRIGTRSFERVVPLLTQTLSNGPHVLRVVAKDASRHHNQTSQDIQFIVDNQPLQAALVRPDADVRVFQGRTVHLQVQTNKPVLAMSAKALSQTFMCVPEAAGSLVYDCYIPVGTEEAPNEYLVTITVTDAVGNVVSLDSKFQVVAYPFRKQNLALATTKIKEENEIGLPAAALEEQLAQLAAQSPAHKLWRGAFNAPVEIRGVTTEFGTMRTTPDRGKYQHNAVDVVSTPKCVIWAPQDGVVVLKERFAHSGNTVVVDHGCGILSLFFHLHDYGPIKVGDKVKRGNPLGTLGMTGYANGYHLHWEMRINNVQIDPMQWITPEF